MFGMVWGVAWWCAVVASDFLGGVGRKESLRASAVHFHPT